MFVGLPAARDCHGAYQYDTTLCTYIVVVVEGDGVEDELGAEVKA